jgi:uncharacterized protein (TIGR03790 family)
VTVRTVVFGWGLSLLAQAWGLSAPAEAVLNPAQLAIVANSNSSESLQVARYYALRRGVPTSHILEIALPVSDTISRSDYEKKLIIPLRSLLEHRGLSSTVRLVVTTYGVPLRVVAPISTEQEQQWVTDATERLRFARRYLELNQERMSRISAQLPSSPSELSPPLEKEPDGNQYLRLLKQLQATIHTARNKLATHAQHPNFPTLKQEFIKTLIQINGRSGLIDYLQPSPSADAATSRQQLERLRLEVGMAQRVVQVLTEVPSDRNRRRAYRLTERVFGLVGIHRLAVTELEQLDYSQGDAALDSELSYLWWDREMYRVAGRNPNPFHYLQTVEGALEDDPPLLMVARLDGPTARVAIQMIDQAIATEKRGLTGKVYVDARGLQSDTNYSYGDYDQSLRDLAELVRAQTTYEVVVDNTPERFSKPGDAPDVAVYAGWYRLRSYEDAFTFLPGAIGYHIASGEAVSVHDPKERGWCKNALERGITVTIGSTGEPYLDAFPMPHEFIGLLMTGQYSLVEAYYLTTRYLSWRMVLFGDPLYNPWHAQPPIKPDQVALRQRTHLGSQAPLPPADRPYRDPLTQRVLFRKAQAQRLEQVERLLADFDRQLDKISPPTKN